MSLQGCFSHFGAAAKLGQVAMVASQWQKALLVLKRQAAALLLSGHRGLKEKAKYHRLGGEGGLISSRLPRSALV